MNRIDRIAKKIVSADEDFNAAEEQMDKACRKYSHDNRNDGSLEVTFRYSKWTGLEYNIGMWSGIGNGDRTMTNCIKATKKREALLEKAKANYKTLIDLKKKLGLPGEVMPM